MTSTSRLFLLTWLASTLGAGYAYQRGQARQAALIARFAVLDGDLVADNQLAAHAAASTVRSISRSTYLNYQQASDQAVLNNSAHILARTQSLTDTLRALGGQLERPGGPPPGLPNQQAKLPASLQNEGAATRQLAAHVARYDKFIRYFEDYNRFESPLTTADFEQVTRQGLPPTVIAAAAISLETQVRKVSAIALQNQAEKVSSKCFICWRYVAQAVPTAATVAPGALYQARLFLAETPAADYGALTMTANGRALDVQREAGGLVEFSVPPRRPGQPDTVRATWRGVIRAHAYPADTTWQVMVPYLIVQHPAP